MTKNETIFICWLVTVMFIFFGVLFTQNVSSETEQGERSEIEQQIIDRNGSPLLVSSYRIGDDVEPKRAMTYCQLLPVKRSVEDNQIYCWTVVE